MRDRRGSEWPGGKEEEEEGGRAPRQGNSERKQ